MHDDVRFVVLTTIGNPYGKAVVNGLKKCGIKPIVISPQPHNFLYLLKWACSRNKCELTDTINSERTEEMLEKIDPDYILLAGCGIVKKNILKTAAYGVLNAHPGTLPFFRNVGVVGRSLLAGYPVQCTLHYVDEGIDTGPIIKHKLVDIREEWDLEDIEKAADAMCIQMLVLAACEINATHTHPVGKPQEDSLGTMCTWLTKEEREDLNAQIGMGLAYDLYEKWKGFAK